ncbi:MAG: hypothetical protein GY913_16390 [Proteobacteria bacterium]|nr:hypothetical protein [Pseudomonadota bacterium]MCP4918484.1 hypothetical protein [Pseudomonadota bacterium]
MTDGVATGAAREFLESARQEFQAAISFQWELDRLEKLGVQPPQRILDVGCSTGDHARRLRELDFHLTGLDLGHNREAARRRVDRFVEGDVREPETWDGLEADVAMARLLLRHVGPQAPAVVGHMAAAAPLVVLVTALPNTMEGATGQLAQALAMMTRLAVPDATGLLRAAGLEVVDEAVFTWTSTSRSDRAAMRFLALPLSEALAPMASLDGEIVAQDMDRWLLEGGPGTFRLGFCAGRRS